MHIPAGAIVVAVLTLVANRMEANPDNASERYVKKHQHPAGHVVVVAEGEFEPRSIGSYSIRIYANAGSAYPTDDYVCGLIQSRDGVVEDVLFVDLDEDGAEEAIVTIRSVGTGAYRSADAFALGNRSLILVATVAGLPQDGDCIAALMGTIRTQQPSKATR